MYACASERTCRASFERIQLRKELEQEQQRQQQQSTDGPAAALVAGASCPVSSPPAPGTTDAVPCCLGPSSSGRSSGRGSSCEGSSGLDCESGVSASLESGGGHEGGDEGGGRGGGGEHVTGYLDTNVANEPDVRLPDSDHPDSVGLAGAAGAWVGTAAPAATCPGDWHEHPHGQGQGQGTCGRGKVRVVSFAVDEPESGANVLQPAGAGAGGAGAGAGAGAGEGGGEGGAAGRVHIGERLPSAAGWPGGGVRAVSYGRLSASVQDAFAHLDMVDGEGGIGGSPGADRSNSGRAARQAPWELEAVAVAAALEEQRLAGTVGVGGDM